MAIEQFPDAAFDSPQERQRVATLLEQYNHPAPLEATTATDTAREVSVADATGTSADSREAVEENGDRLDANDPDDLQAEVRMTPEIDSGFAQLAEERASRYPLRTYLLLPAQRAISLWFSTHSRYYPSGGNLFPLSTLPNPEARYVVEYFPLLATAGGLALAALGWRRRLPPQTA